LLLLSSKTFDDIATFRGKTKLRNEITSRLNAFLVPGSIKKVYFVEFVVQ
jgi:flagellar FliL protein